MPLKAGSSNDTREQNIGEMIDAGHPPDQAVAAGYRKQRESKGVGVGKKKKEDEKPAGKGVGVGKKKDSGGDTHKMGY